ncbi:MAG: YihY/virulence factor BrkB family protein [Terracidiphilus sp.]
MADLSNSGTADGKAVLEPAGTGAAEAVTWSKWYRWRREGTALVNYLLDSEVHTYAFSVAANAILSFIPFTVLLYTLSQSVFHSATMVRVVDDMVNYFLPSVARQDWVANNLAAAASHQGIRAFSLLMILVACTGIFLPLEVALNQAWGVAKSRNYLANQVVAFGLAILMLVLALASIFLNAGAQGLLAILFFHHTDNFVFQGISMIWLAATTGVASILFFFSIYWLLPNRKVPWRPVLRTSIYTGTLWLVAKLVFVAVLPHLDLKALYGPFFVSVGLLFWAYISGLILFAGAQFSVARLGNGNGLAEKPFLPE